MKEFHSEEQAEKVLTSVSTILEKSEDEEEAESYKRNIKTRTAYIKRKRATTKEGLKAQMTKMMKLAKDKYRELQTLVKLFAFLYPTLAGCVKTCFGHMVLTK